VDQVLSEDLGRQDLDWRLGRGAIAGAGYRNRTDDLLFTRQLLYQLS
jgi:hypothetical protein